MKVFENTNFNPVKQSAIENYNKWKYLSSIAWNFSSIPYSSIYAQSNSVIS